MIIEPGEAGKDAMVSRRVIVMKTISMSLTTLSIGIDPVRFDVVNVYTLALPNTGRALPPAALPVGLAGLLVALVGVVIFAADRRRRRT